MFSHIHCVMVYVISSWRPIWFPQYMMFMVYKSKMMSATNGSGHAHHSRTTEFIPGVLLCSCCRIFYFSVLCFVDHCLSFCTLSFWSLCCLFFFYLRILITPLISSHFKTLTSDSWMTTIFVLMMMKYMALWY